jgi:ribonuclease P protein component
MKKLYRVKDNRDFSTIIKEGKKIKTTAFSVYYLNNSLNYTRVGISVSKKIGNAVVRSTTRRRIRAVIDTTLNFQDFSLDIIVIARSNILNMSYEELIGCFKEVLESIKK